MSNCTNQLRVFFNVNCLLWLPMNCHPICYTYTFDSPEDRQIASDLSEPHCRAIGRHVLLIHHCFENWTTEITREMHSTYLVRQVVIRKCSSGEARNSVCSQGANEETDEDGHFWNYQWCTEMYMGMARDGGKVYVFLSTNCCYIASCHLGRMWTDGGVWKSYGRGRATSGHTHHLLFTLY